MSPEHFKIYIPRAPPVVVAKPTLMMGQLTSSIVTQVRTPIVSEQKITSSVETVVMPK